MRLSAPATRRLAAGGSLIAGPGLVLAGFGMFPSVADDDAVWVADIAHHQTRAALGIVLAMVGVSLSVFAYLTLARLLRERRSALANIGGFLAVAGSVMFAAVGGIVLAEVETIQHLGASDATAATIKAVDRSAGAAVPYIGNLAATIGLVLLAYGLLRTRIVPWPLPVLLAVGIVAQTVSLAGGGSLPILIAGSACIFVALAAVGVRLLTRPAELWPETDEPSVSGSAAIGQEV